MGGVVLYIFTNQYSILLVVSSLSLIPFTHTKSLLGLVLPTGLSSFLCPVAAEAAVPLNFPERFCIPGTPQGCYVNRCTLYAVLYTNIYIMQRIVT
jgi:hypothetical protein